MRMLYVAFAVFFVILVFIFSIVSSERDIGFWGIASMGFVFVLGVTFSSVAGFPRERRSGSLVVYSIISFVVGCLLLGYPLSKIAQNMIVGGYLGGYTWVANGFICSVVFALLSYLFCKTSEPRLA